MTPSPGSPPVTICVLTYGDFLRLARRCLDSILRHCDRSQYRLVVGANAVAPATAEYLAGLEAEGRIDRLVSSPVNLHKDPMMRGMFAGIETELVWWFDDDAHVTDDGALAAWLAAARQAPADVVAWGRRMFCEHPLSFWEGDAVAFVRSAAWYRGLPPPSWRVGGKGEMNYRGRGTGNGRWEFILGGCWLARTRAIRQLDWPDPRLLVMGDDVFLGEAIRQQGWRFAGIETGVVMADEPRRWRLDPGGHMAAAGPAAIQGSSRSVELLDEE